jgi:ubiquinone/menaquinone biosynthesis C-methylase UbiE
MGMSSDEQQITAREYDRWLQENTFLAMWMRFWLSPKRTLWLNTQIRKLPVAARLTPPDRVLDIGCGYGGLLIHLVREVGFNQPAEALDSSPLMLGHARKEICRRNLEGAIRINQGMATKLPFGDGAFDVVVCSYMIKHLPDDLLGEMFHEVKRVLKPGGRFCVWEVAPSRYGFMNVWNLKLLRLVNSVIHLRSTAELRVLLEAAGFIIDRPFGQGLYYYYPILPRVGFVASRCRE